MMRPRCYADDMTALSAAPTTVRFQEKREAILGAAARLFNREGVKGATLAEIAGSVGLVTNSVTYYYRKKEDLARACFLRSIEVVNRLVEQSQQAPTVAERLQRYFRLHAQLLAAIDVGEHPMLILFNDLRALPSPQQEEVFEAYTDMFRRMRGLFDAPESALLSRLDRNARTHLLVTVAHGLRSWIGRYEADEYVRVADRISDLLLNGLGAAGARWPSDAELDAALPALAAVSGPGPDTAPAAELNAESFLRAATLLVNEQGYRGASVDKISARLHVTKGAFYHHIDNKLDLIAACFERSFDVQRQVYAAAESAPGSGWLRVAAASAALVRYQLSEHGPLLRATATSALPDAEHRARVHRTMLRLSERMASVVVDGMVDGSIRPQDPAVAAQVASAMINAAAEVHRWVPGIDADNAARLYVRPCFDGVLCPPSR